MTQIDIISGFLGAGKTTFIQKLLQEALKGENVVLIENEFGEIGIDSDFLKNSGIEIREMNQGCICCSLVGDFETSLKEVIEKYQPDRILIEPSGVGKLSDILSAVKTVSANLPVHLDGAVTVVDASKAKLYNKNFGEFFDDQIRFATTVLLSRTDTAKEEKVEEAVAIVRKVNPKANLITTPIQALSGGKLLEIIGHEENLEEALLEEVREKAAHHHDHHDHNHHHHGEEGHEHCSCGIIMTKRSTNTVLTMTKRNRSTVLVVITMTKRSTNTVIIMTERNRSIIIAVAGMTMMRMKFLTVSVWKSLRKFLGISWRRFWKRWRKVLLTAVSFGQKGCCSWKTANGFSLIWYRSRLRFVTAVRSPSVSLL